MSSEHGWWRSDEIYRSRCRQLETLLFVVNRFGMLSRGELALTSPSERASRWWGRSVPPQLSSRSKRKNIELGSNRLSKWIVSQTSKVEFVSLFLGRSRFLLSSFDISELSKATFNLQLSLRNLDRLTRLLIESIDRKGETASTLLSKRTQTDDNEWSDSQLSRSWKHLLCKIEVIRRSGKRRMLDRFFR